MDNLRLILLLIGCLLVLGIYLWDVFFRPETRKNSDMPDAVDDPPDPGAPGHAAERQQGHTSVTGGAGLGRLLAKSRDARPGQNDRPGEPLKPGGDTGQAAAGPVPMRRERGVFRISPDRAAAEFRIRPGAGQARAAHAKPAAGDAPRDHGQGEALLILYIVSPDDTGFNGLSISEAARGAGMAHGHMNIFHHFGSGGPPSSKPLFSMANMYEPGAFDRAAMAELQTTGVVLFMYSPTAPAPVFDLFLDATQRMARALGGDILTAERQPLTATAALALRERVVSANGKPSN